MKLNPLLFGWLCGFVALAYFILLGIVLDVFVIEQGVWREDAVVFLVVISHLFGFAVYQERK